jgi:hypothetical protein
MYVKVLLSCGKHLHDSIISLRDEVRAIISSLPLLIEVPVTSWESDRPCTYVY